MRDDISSHYSNDDDRHFRFSRNSGIPHGYWRRSRVDPDHVVYGFCLAVLVLLLVLPL